MPFDNQYTMQPAYPDTPAPKQDLSWDDILVPESETPKELSWDDILEPALGEARPEFPVLTKEQIEQNELPEGFHYIEAETGNSYRISGNKRSFEQSVRDKLGLDKMGSMGTSLGQDTSWKKGPKTKEEFAKFDMFSGTDPEADDVSKMREPATFDSYTGEVFGAWNQIWHNNVIDNPDQLPTFKDMPVATSKEEQEKLIKGAKKRDLMLVPISGVQGTWENSKGEREYSYGRPSDDDFAKGTYAAIPKSIKAAYITSKPQYDSLPVGSMYFARGEGYKIKGEEGRELDRNAALSTHTQFKRNIQGMSSNPYYQSLLSGMGRGAINIANQGYRAGEAVGLLEEGFTDDVSNLTSDQRAAQSSLAKGSPLADELGGAVESLMTTVAAGPGGLPAIVGSTALQTYNSSVAEYRRKGDKNAESRALTDAAVEGMITLAFSKLGKGFGGYEDDMAKMLSANKKVLNESLRESFKNAPKDQMIRGFKRVMGEQAEENLIEFEKLFRDPEFHKLSFEKAVEKAKETWAQTSFQAGIQQGPSAVLSSANIGSDKPSQALETLKRQRELRDTQRVEDAKARVAEQGNVAQERFKGKQLDERASKLGRLGTETSKELRKSLNTLSEEQLINYAAKETLSRKDVESLGVKRSSKEEREAALADIKEMRRNITTKPLAVERGPSKGVGLDDIALPDPKVKTDKIKYTKEEKQQLKKGIPELKKAWEADPSNAGKQFEKFMESSSAPLVAKNRYGVDISALTKSPDISKTASEVETVITQETKPSPAPKKVKKPDPLKELPIASTDPKVAAQIKRRDAINEQADDFFAAKYSQELASKPKFKKKNTLEKIRNLVEKRPNRARELALSEGLSRKDLQDLDLGKSLQVNVKDRKLIQDTISEFLYVKDGKLGEKAPILRKPVKTRLTLPETSSQEKASPIPKKKDRAVKAEETQGKAQPVAKGTKFEGRPKKEIAPKKVKPENKKEEAVNKAVEETKSLAINAELPKAIQDAMAEAQKEQGVEALGMAGGGLLIPKMKRVDESEITKSERLIAKESPEFFERRSKAYGRAEDTNLNKVRKWLKGVYKKVTEAQEYIDNNLDGAAVKKEHFRLSQESKKIGESKANVTVASILSQIPRNEKSAELKSILEDKIILEDQVAGAKRGEILSFGFKNLADAQKALDAVNKEMEQFPSLKKAYDIRSAAIQELGEQLQSIGYLDKGISKEDLGKYYHREVHYYQRMAELDGVSKGGLSDAALKRKKADRPGAAPKTEEFDINTNYFEAERAFLANAYAALHQHELNQKLVKMFDRTKEFKDKYGEGWEEHVDRDPTVDKYVLGAQNPSALAQVQEILTQEGLKEAGIEASVQAVGKTVVFPIDLVNQLREQDAQRIASMKKGNVVGRLAKNIQNAWKFKILFGKPVSYWIRNKTGDVDVTAMGAPGVFKRAADMGIRTDLWKYYMSKDILETPAYIQEAADLGVMDSSMTAQEIPDVKDLPLLNYLYDGKEGKALDKIRKSINKIKDFNAYTESHLRLIAYLHFDEALTKGNGKLEHYGGASKDVVEALYNAYGSKVAAAHMSRNLLGDYGNLTVFGNWMRKYMAPFYSFFEINTKRIPKIAYNALKGGSKEKGQAALFAVKTLAMSRLFWGYALVELWNRLMFEDEEEELAPYETRTPHIILGHKDPKTGETPILRNVGAMGEFMETFGLNKAIQDLDKYSEGQVSLGDIATEMPNDVSNKFVGMMGPHIKGPVEVGLGVSLFPDFTKPRTTNRDEAAAGVIGEKDAWAWAKGKIEKDGSRPRPNWALRWLLGSSNADKASISKLHDLKDSFLKNKGEATKSGYGVSKYKNLRDAAFNNDQEAFDEAKAHYLKNGGSYDKFLDSLEDMDPVKKMKKDLRSEFLMEYLMPEQKEQYRHVQTLVEDSKAKMLQMWGTDSTPEQTKELSKKSWSGTNEKHSPSAREILVNRIKQGATLEQLQAELTSYAESHDMKTQRVRKGKVTPFGKRLDRLETLYNSLKKDQ